MSEHVLLITADSEWCHPHLQIYIMCAIMLVIICAVIFGVIWPFFAFKKYLSDLKLFSSKSNVDGSDLKISYASKTLVQLSPRKCEEA